MLGHFRRKDFACDVPLPNLQFRYLLSRRDRFSCTRMTRSANRKLPQCPAWIAIKARVEQRHVAWLHCGTLQSMAAELEESWVSEALVELRRSVEFGAVNSIRYTSRPRPAGA